MPSSSDHASARRDALTRLQRELARLRKELTDSQADTERFTRLEQEGRLTDDQKKQFNHHLLETEALRHRLRQLSAEFEELRDRRDE